MRSTRTGTRGRRYEHRKNIMVKLLFKILTFLFFKKINTRITAGNATSRGKFADYIQYETHRVRRSFEKKKKIYKYNSQTTLFSERCDPLSVFRLKFY